MGGERGIEGRIEGRGEWEVEVEGGGGGGGECGDGESGREVDTGAEKGSLKKKIISMIAYLQALATCKCIGQLEHNPPTIC